MKCPEYGKECQKGCIEAKEVGMEDAAIFEFLRELVAVGNSTTCKDVGNYYFGF